MTNNNNFDESIYAQAVPVPASTQELINSSSMRSHMDHSSYILPQNNGTKEVNATMMNSLKAQGFTTGESIHFFKKKIS